MLEMPCSSLFTEPGWNLHTPQEVAIDDFHANCCSRPALSNNAIKRIVHAHEGRLLSDGRFATLREFVEHYNRLFGLQLAEIEINDLVEYLKSL
jgi:hypothetical protein